MLEKIRKVVGTLLTKVRNTIAVALAVVRRKTERAVEAARPWANISGIVLLQAVRCLAATIILVALATLVGVGAVTALATVMVAISYATAWEMIVTTTLAAITAILVLGTARVWEYVLNWQAVWFRVMGPEVLATAAVAAMAITVQVAAIRDARQGVVEGSVVSTTVATCESVEVEAVVAEQTTVASPTTEQLARRAKLLELLRA